jgi:beta-galactosidase
MNATKLFIVTIVAVLFIPISINSRDINNRISFDFNWKFALGDFPDASKTDFNDANWRSLNVPHDFSIEHPFDSTKATNSGGGFAYSGIGWYRKNLKLDKSTVNKKVSILFEGIYRNSEVWINGHYLGLRPYGYSSFYYDLTPYLKPAGENNVIAVKANTSEQPNSRWYTGAGIYRHVWLLTTDKVHFEEWGVFVKTQTASNANAQLSIDLEIVNEFNTEKDCKLSTFLIDANGKKVCGNSSGFKIEIGDTLNITQQLTVKKPNLWSINNPYLYQIQVEISADGKVMDAYKTPFGIRTFKFDPNKGFFLNGEHVKLKGTNNHHDGGPLGAACLDYTFERQLTILKEMGCNALRMSHNPPAPELLNAADRMGFVVFNEIFDEWEKGKNKHGYSPYFYDWYEKDVKNWIKRDRNHASVFAWSIGNEVPEQWDSVKGPMIAKLILDAAKKYDVSRPFTIGADGIPGINSSGMGNLLELVGYNYQESMYPKDHISFPNRVIFGSETVMYPYHAGDCWQMRSYKEWLSTLKEDYIVGEFLWTGFDYIGEGGIGEVVKECGEDLIWPWWPSKGASCGLVDICGFEKPSYYFRKAIWTNEPVVYIAVETDSTAKDWSNCSFWNWPKVLSHWNHTTEGDTLAVHVYTNVPDVELKLNNKSLGSQHWDLDKQAFLIWNVPYSKGTLEAIGTLPNGERKTFKVQTAGKPAKIKLIADKQNLKANQRDLSYIKAFVLDKNDIPVPFADNTIDFEVTGVGTLNATGNGNEKNHDCYKGKQTQAYLGKCLAIVQSGSEKGIINIVARSKGLPDVKVEIEVE